MFVYLCNIKIHALKLNELLKPFCILLALEGISPETVVQMFEEVIVSLLRRHGNKTRLCSLAG